MRRIFPHVFIDTPSFFLLGMAGGDGGATTIGFNKGGLTGVGILPILLFAVVLPGKGINRIHPSAASRGGFVCHWGLSPRGDLEGFLDPASSPHWPACILGYFFMGHISNAVFSPLIGWIIIGLIALQFLRHALGEKIDHVFESCSFGLFMGVLAGITTMIANAAGPVANLYFLSVRLPKWNLIGTSACVFFRHQSFQDAIQCAARPG